MILKYTYIFKANHLKYFNKEIWIFLFKLKKELKKIRLTQLQRLPKRSKEFTVIKSPTVMKSFREQFKIDNHSILCVFSIKSSKYNLFLLDKIFTESIFNQSQNNFLGIKLTKTLKN